MAAGKHIGDRSERADTLRRKIALYRRYLREGGDAPLAAKYLQQIADMTRLN